MSFYWINLFLSNSLAFYRIKIKQISMSLDQVVNAGEVEQLQSDDEDEVFFQDIEVLQNHGIVSQSPVHVEVLFKS